MEDKFSKIKTVNPATGELIAEYTPFSNTEIEDRLARAEVLFYSWSRRKLSERVSLLRSVKTELERRSEECAKLMTVEMGKPIVQARAEIKKCILMFDSVFENAERWLDDRAVAVAPDEAWITFRPTGVLLAIMPWNFPFWQVLRFAIPQLAAGNVVLLKHASNSTGVALLIEQIFKVETIETSLIQALIIPGSKMAPVIQDRRVRGVSLTGSTEAGRKVASLAGQALKKHVLELGGSDAYVVLEDADVELAARACVQSRLINSGQSCIAAKRFIVHRQISDRFITLVQKQMEMQIVGPPLDKHTTVGPLARHDLRDDICGQIEKARTDGVEMIWGGQIPAGPGAFLRPGFAVVRSIKNEIFKNEVFGPFAAIAVVPDDEKAIELANASSYGLGGAIFSRDWKRAIDLAARMECGSCFINDYVKSDPRVPFGGTKDSGYGRELTEFGMYEFLNIQTVWRKN
jgi:succinate-semialdehyde dehydrogenase/glutarate-semialdehyde dehydrogenase